MPALLAGALVVVDAPAAENASVDFRRDVAPLFQSRCIRCHQSSDGASQFSLATPADLETHGYVVPGNPDASHLIELVASVGGAPPQMPKESPPLSSAELDTLRQWIAQGARWPEDVALRERPRADRTWWSLQPLKIVDPPANNLGPEWNVSPIDRLIAARLAADHLQPNPPADHRTLIRRLTYDLTGLPPTPEEIDAFVADQSADAYERLVDRLLASPRYGEHWGRHWLDVVRFGESDGYEVNALVENSWPFRDYVINSLNADKPFDRFIVEHLAGDAVGPGDPAVEVGLTFLVCGPVDIVTNSDPVRAAQIRADTVDEIIRATGEAFLGLTVGCARCHDHKFDPITQADYYQLYATFAGVYHDDRQVAPADKLRERTEALASLESQKQKLLASRPDPAVDAAAAQVVDAQVAELDRQAASVPSPPMLHVGRFEQSAAPQSIFLGGDASRLGDSVVPASPSTLADAATPYTLAADSQEQSRRIALARWLTSTDNPLTPRVLANRIWQHHFGAGIVATPSDFGYMGEKPTHPELLDWLARQLVDGGWRLKPLHRLMVTSQTYRQSSALQDNAATIDADARLLWRFPPRRLSAEEIRDAILSLAAQLDERRGGPGFRLYDYTRDNVATYTPRETVGPETFRRAVYHQNARAARIDLLTDFDAPDCAFSVARRTLTTTPTQALALLNHNFTMQMANYLAARLESETSPGSLTAQIARGFELAYGRSPDAEEEAAALDLTSRHGLRAFCRALLNSNEFLFLD